MSREADLQELMRGESPPHDCAYLPSRLATFEHRLILRISPEIYLELLERGWRRFGYDFFRPICQGCLECRPLRVDVAAFEPSKSQRRNLRRNRNIELVVEKPGICHTRLDLFERYHADMNRRKGWPPTSISEAEYEASFLGLKAAFAKEFQYWDQGKLIGVGLVDQLSNALSSVYFFHDPEYRSQGLGVYSLLRELEHARTRSLDYLYLGYWIKDCGSMSYKANYQPFELLDAFVDDESRPDWKRPEGTGEPS